jgi:branched-chain amino acid aminotransferase
MSVYYIDGEFVRAEQAVLPVSDLIILRGYGVFDFLRTYNGVPFHLDAHIRRLLNSATLIGLACPWDFQEIKDITFETMARNSYAESNIRLLISGGDSEDSITPGQKPRLLVLVSAMRSFPREWYDTGVGITTADVTRYIPGAKSIDYIRGILALGEANGVGGVEAVYVDPSGRVTEGTTSNIFIVKDGEVITPPDEILPGVTRDVVLDIITPICKYQLDFFSREELYAADEVFLSSSNKEVMPVRMVDETLIGDGSPGPVTQRIMAEFRSYTEQYSAENPL